MNDMEMPTLGAFVWDLFLGITFVLGPTIALERKNASAWRRAALAMACAAILCILDIIQKQDPDDLKIYIVLFLFAGLFELTAIILGTALSEGSIYKRMVVNASTIIFTSALVFAGTSFSEEAKKVMAAETTARDSEGIGYLIVCVVQLAACVIAALLVKLLLKWIKGDGIVYKIIFALIMLYDMIGVPARGYVNFKARHEAPERNEVLVVLGITYLLMTATIVVVIAIALNLSKGAESRGIMKRMISRQSMEKKIIGEIEQEEHSVSDDTDRVLNRISEELKQRGMVLELLSDMDEVKDRLKDKTVRLNEELESVCREIKSKAVTGGYMTLCVRPLGDTYMFMCELSSDDGSCAQGSRTITKVL